MKSRLFATVVALFVGVTTLCAQQNLWQREAVVSPEINGDGSVTFRLYAPSAESVMLVGDCVAGDTAMTRAEDGVWEYTTAPLASELYCYWFKVDGMDHVNDPAMNRWRYQLEERFVYFKSSRSNGQRFLDIRYVPPSDRDESAVQDGRNPLPETSVPSVPCVPAESEVSA